MAKVKPPPKDSDGEFILSRSVEEAEGRIRYFSARARLGQWGLVIFGFFSLGVFYFSPWLDTMQGELKETLGPAPPVRLVSIALAVYAFSALLYILARMMKGDYRYRGWSHLGYLCGFYFFFAYGGALRENFWAILVAGLTILTLEFYRLWSQCQDAIRQEKQTIGNKT
jgi:hypothetical protein